MAARPGPAEPPCYAALVPEANLPVAERLYAFVRREGRLPQPGPEGELILYRQMYQTLSTGLRNGQALRPEVYNLMRREEFYQTAFLSFVASLPPGVRSTRPATLARIALFRRWGDDPFPPSAEHEFFSLVKAQAERRFPNDGRRAFDGLNEFAEAHGRLPKRAESSLTRDRLTAALTAAYPSLLQLSPRALALVRGTLQYQRRRASFLAEWRSSPGPSPELRYRAAVWRLLGRYQPLDVW